MRPITCDACGQTFGREANAFFTWSITSNPILPPADGETADAPHIDPDLDSIDEMDAMLIERRSEHDTVEMLPVCVQRQYEVCRDCYSRLIADPLGIESRRLGPFSRN